MLVICNLCRLMCITALDRASVLVTKLDRASAAKTLEHSAEGVRRHLESLIVSEEFNEEEKNAEVSVHLDPILTNLSRCKTYVGEWGWEGGWFRWVDGWVGG